MYSQNQNPFEQINQLNELTASIVKRTSDCSLETINDFLNVGNKHVKDLSSNPQNAEEIIKLANEVGATYMNCSQRAFNVALENFTDFTKWLENNSQNLNPLNQVKSFSEQAAQQARSFGEQAVQQAKSFTEKAGQHVKSAVDKANK